MADENGAFSGLLHCLHNFLGFPAAGEMGIADVQHPQAASSSFSSWIPELGPVNNAGEVLHWQEEASRQQQRNRACMGECRGNKKIKHVLGSTREGVSATKRGMKRKKLLGSNLTLADQRPNLCNISRRWSSFLALVSNRYSSLKKGAFA